MCTWTHEPLTVHVPKYMSFQSLCGDNQATLFSGLHINYAHLTYVRFEHAVCHGSLMTTKAKIEKVYQGVS